MALFRFSLSLQMVVGTILGILVGIFFGELAGFFGPWADAYVMVLKITAIPYLICAIIHGVGQLRSAQIKEILKKGMLFIALAWFLNISMVYASTSLMPAVQGGGAAQYLLQKPAGLNFAELLIPQNIFYALSNNVIPAIVIFSLLIGISLIYLSNKTPAMDLLDISVGALSSITGWISKITPIGTFLIIAGKVGTTQFSTIKQLSSYIIIYIMTALIVIFWIFPRLIAILTPISYFKWIRTLLPILLLGYTTNLIVVCLPYIIALVSRETELLYPKDEKAKDQVQGIVSIIFNLPFGSIFTTLFIFFVAKLYQIHISANGQLELYLTTFLTSLGSIGIGSWLNSLTFILDSLTIPLDSIEIFLTTLPFTGGFQTAISAMCLSSLSLLITLACRKKIAARWYHISKHFFFTAFPIFLLYTGFHIYLPFPSIVHDKKTIYDVHAEPGTPVIIFKPGDPLPLTYVLPNEDLFDRILRTKTVKVGYYPHIPPFSFNNKYGQLVGYDIASAYELARNLGCRLELIPLDYAYLAEDLKTGVYDIAMSGVTITEPRLKEILFSNPYLDGRLIFVVHDSLRNKFASLDTLNKQKGLRIGVLKQSIYEEIAYNLLSNHEIVLLDTFESFPSERQVDAILWSEPQALTWAAKYPQLHVVALEPDVPIRSYAYAMAPHATRLNAYINGWLILKENEGFSEKQYALWVEGKTSRTLPDEPRWSVIRDVLHWVN